MIINVAGLPKQDINLKIFCFYEKTHSEKDSGNNHKA